MDDRRVGRGLKTIRLRLGRTQDEVGIASGTSRFIVGRIERGRLERVPVGTVRAVAAALDADLGLVLRWRGGELGRVVNARHAAMHEALAGRFASLPGWTYEPEVSFSEWGERGVIDGLAWHAATRSLLMIELKTELVDVNDLMATMDRRLRLAPEIVRDRGWTPRAVSGWVVIADGRTNRRAVARHATTLRAKLPDDGHAVRRWLRAPSGSVRALGFLSIEHHAHGGASVAGTRRVRHARPAALDHPSHAR